MNKENEALSQQLCELCGIEARPLGCTNEDIFCDRKTFIECLLKHIQCEDVGCDEIKQSIRNYDGWVWG